MLEEEAKKRMLAGKAEPAEPTESPEKSGDPEAPVPQGRKGEKPKKPKKKERAPQATDEAGAKTGVSGRSVLDFKWVEEKSEKLFQRISLRNVFSFWSFFRSFFLKVEITRSKTSLPSGIRAS